MKLHRLTIERANLPMLSVHGTEEVLRAELDAWVKFETDQLAKAQAGVESGQEYVDFESQKPRVVNAMSDSADRAEVVVAYRFIDVVGMVLVEL